MGAPSVCDYAFVAAEPSRGFIFKVYNGGLEDTTFEPVSSSTITLNGTEILGPSNFNQNVTYLEVPVSLQAQNSLTVEVRGKPGGALILKVFPFVMIDTPTDAQLFNALPISVSGHLNASATSVAVNGVPAAVSGTSFSVSGVPLAQGTNIVTAAATRVGGFQDTDSVEVTLDSEAPTVSISYPPEGLLTNELVVPVYTVADTLDPNPSVAVVPPPPYTAEGAQQMTLTATDWAGNQTQVVRSFVIDRTPPVVGGLIPAPNATAEDAALTISAGFSDALSGVDPDSLRLSLDGNDVTSAATVTVDGVSYHPNVPLVGGVHHITLVVRDRAGNEVAAGWSFTLDGTPPVITVLSPSAGAFTNQDVSIAYNVEDNVDPNPTVALDPPPPYIAEGSYHVTITATDHAGNQSTTALDFVIDKTLPVIGGVQPSNGAVLAGGSQGGSGGFPPPSGLPPPPGGSTLTIAATYGDALSGLVVGSVRLLVNGLDVTTSALVFPTSATYIPSAVSDGTISMQVTVRDRAGNQASRAWSITVDSLPPVISIQSPANQSVANHDVTLAFSVEDLLDPNPTVITIPPPPYSAEGNYQVTVIANDWVGNQSQATRSFTIDKTPPVIGSPMPSPGAFLADGMPLVSVEWNDPLGGLDLSSARLVLDGVEMTATSQVTASGISFQPGAFLPQGLHRVLVTVKDCAGNESSLNWDFTIDAVPPVISISSPAQGLATNQDVILAYTVQDNLDESPTVGVVPPPPYSSEGVFHVVITATDRAGNQAQATRDFVIDRTAPEVIFDSPAEGLLTNQDVVPGYTVVDDLDPQPASALTPAPPYATEGSYHVTLTATDWAGNSTVAARSFVIDRTAPVLSIDFPTEGLVTNLEVVPEYTVTDSLDQQPAVAAAPPPPYTAEGLHRVVFTATDWAGNRSEIVRNFTVDRTPPAIAILWPTEGITVDTSAVDLTGTVDDASAAVSVNGNAVILSGTTFTFPALPLEPGANTILIVADDALGNRSTAEVHVYCELVQLPATLTATAASIALGQTVTLSWDTRAAARVLIEPGIGDVPASGSITVSPTATTRYVLTAVGDSGVASAESTITVLGSPAAQPEGSFGLGYADLVPPDATIADYDQRHFAVVTGVVADSAGQPLPEVRVTVNGRPELGTAITDSEGRYSLPVEGGGLLTLTLRKSGFLAAQRPVRIGWNAIENAEIAVMTAADPLATTIVPDGDASHAFVHRGSEVTTEFGTRAATVVLTGDTRAYAQTEAGEVEIPAFELRATEFTTPEAMPANLPPSSAFTYCVDLSASGLEKVRFSKPVTVYVDNFLGFDVGISVPAGSYDYATSVWTPSLDGKVVRLLDGDGDGIVDALDAGGDGLPDDLDGDGDFADEAIGLDDPVRYAAGATFWRVRISHLTPWDFNWPWGFGPFDIPPNATTGPFTEEKRSGDQCVTTGSYAECQGRVLHEDLPIPGTDLSLHYASDRTEGYQTVVVVPASGETVPTTLKYIVVKLKIAGRELETTLLPAPRQVATFSWDGRDYLGRRMAGTVPAEVRIGFAYRAVYYASRAAFETSFARAGGNGTSAPTPFATQQLVISWKSIDILVHRDGLQIGELGAGWTLSAHHRFSPSDPTVVYKGDGTVLEQGTQILSTLEGSYNNAAAYEYCDQSAGPTYCYPAGLASDAAGNLYVADAHRHCVRKVDRNGTVTTIAGRPGSGGYSGDGGPATQARLSRPFAIAVDPAGNLYVSDTDNYRVRKIDTSGAITTVAGNGNCHGIDENIPAVQATYCPQVPGGSVAVDSWGNLYLADYGNAVVRKVRPDGIIENIVKYPTVEGPSAVAVDSQGNLYIADVKNYFVLKYSTTGRLTPFAGIWGVWGHSGNGGPALSAHLDGPMYLFVDKGDNVYISSPRYVRKVDTNGIITTVTGVGSLFGGTGSGTPAVTASIAWPAGLTMTGDGTLFVASKYINAIHKISLPGVSEAATGSGELRYADQNGLGYIFTQGGRHKATVDLRTGVRLHSFAYGSGGLESMSDRFGNTTRIERNGAGLPTAIVAADGQVTELDVDAAGNLVGVIYPDGTRRIMAYDAHGLLTDAWDPRGMHSSHEFDPSGRVLDTYDAGGGHRAWTRSFDHTGKILTSLQGPEGDIALYEEKNSSTGYTSNRTAADDSVSSYFQSADLLSESLTPPWGGSLTYSYTTDSRTKARIMKQAVLKTPAALTTQRVYSRSYLDSDGDGAADAVTETETVNGRQWRLTDDILSGTRTITSPAGRVATLTYQPGSLLADGIQVPGIMPTDFVYDARGRLSSVTVGDRTTAMSYDSNGNPDYLVSPDGKTYDYTYDIMGRLSSELRPDGGTVEYQYDESGNLSVLVNPNLVAYRFDANANNQRLWMGHPLSGDYLYQYDRDRRLQAVHLPSGRTVLNTYLDGNLAATGTAEGTIVFSYASGGRLATASRGGESIALSYDGALVTADARSGTIGKTISYAYNNELAVSSMTYAGATVARGYDADGLMITADSYTISRDAQNGLPLSISGNGLSLGRSFDGYGELDGQTWSIGGSSTYSWAATQDPAGRIISRDEQIDGESIQWAYRYDAGGRLLEVDRNGTLVEQYTYDLNGNRLTEMNGLREISVRPYTHSAEDHLLSAGSDSYVFDVDGFLQSWTTQEGTSNFSYSSRGELLRVDNPDGTILSYVHDPLGRRIAKRVNGTTVEKYLWKDRTMLLAVYDGNNNLLQRFVYTDARTAISMTAGGATYFLLTDQVGTLRAVADSTGMIVKRVDYDSFGNIIADTNPGFSVPFGFAGGLHDRETGLVRFGYRDYSPELGRFVAKDPIDFDGGDTNLYAYVMNDPVNIVDPSGFYGEDVHLDLTLKLALYRVRMNPNVASTIAQANQGMDTGANNPFNPFAGLGLHFQPRMYAQTGLELAIERGDPVMFGEFLHMLQDSYSHKGYSWPFGHALDSLLGVTPDSYDECNPRDYKMKDETVYWLTEYAKHNNR